MVRDWGTGAWTWYYGRKLTWQLHDLGVGTRRRQHGQLGDRQRDAVHAIGTAASTAMYVCQRHYRCGLTAVSPACPSASRPRPRAARLRSTGSGILAPGGNWLVVRDWGTSAWTWNTAG